MSEVKEIVRTKSQKFLGMLETALNLPVTLERQLSREDGQGNILTRALSTRRPSKKEEEEYEAKFNGGYFSSLTTCFIRKLCRRDCEPGGQGEVRGHDEAAVLHQLRGAVCPSHHSVQEGAPLLHQLQDQQQDLQGVQADHGGCPQHCSGQVIVFHCPSLQVWVTIL